jgi:hypothetical protein
MTLHLLCFFASRPSFSFSFFYPLDGSERLSICPWPQKSRYILKLDSICASNSHILNKNSNTNNFSRSITRTCEILALPLISDIQGSRAQGLKGSYTCIGWLPESPADVFSVSPCTPLVPPCILFRHATIHISFLRRLATARQHFQTIDGYMLVHASYSRTASRVY